MLWVLLVRFDTQQVFNVIQPLSNFMLFHWGPGPLTPTAPMQGTAVCLEFGGRWGCACFWVSPPGSAIYELWILSISLDLSVLISPFVKRENTSRVVKSKWDCQTHCKTQWTAGSIFGSLPIPCTNVGSWVSISSGLCSPSTNRES